MHGQHGAGPLLIPGRLLAWGGGRGQGQACETHASPEGPDAPYPAAPHLSTGAGGTALLGHCEALGRSPPRRKCRGSRRPLAPASASPPATHAGRGPSLMPGMANCCGRRWGWPGAERRCRPGEGGCWEDRQPLEMKEGKVKGDGALRTSGGWVRTCCFQIWKDRKSHCHYKCHNNHPSHWSGEALVGGQVLSYLSTTSPPRAQEVIPGSIIHTKRRKLGEAKSEATQLVRGEGKPGLGPLGQRLPRAVITQPPLLCLQTCNSGHGLRPEYSFLSNNCLYYKSLKSITWVSTI